MAKIRGAKELRAAIRKMPVDLREEATKEVKIHTDRMHRKVMELLASAASFAPLYHGKPGMQNITGTARRNYRKSISDKGMTGRVGLLSAAAESNAYYLRIFFSGSVHQPARPVHDTAFEMQREDFLFDQGRALERVLRRFG